ncbi:MAG: hypothetical protein HYY85_01750 [Deltaproteobacteria bacterium]|nr:hypothetical protein [Deltaproteobacteria bacterium]
MSSVPRCRQCLRLELHTNRARESYGRGFYQRHGFREADSALLRWDALR